MPIKPVIRRTSGSHQLSDDLPPLVQRVLAARGITLDAQISQSLTDLPDPFTMKGMQQAVDRLLAARDRNESITIVGDFDADGATSTALLQLFLAEAGFCQVNFFVPNRFEFGYGLSVEAIDALRWQSPGLIITVDNGIASHAGVDYANSLGMDVLITDHHLPQEKLPEAKAIINPNQQGCPFPAKNIAGVGVVFFLAMALRQALRKAGRFDVRPEPNLAKYLDLVALGTVADVVEMDFYNRILVGQGIRRIRSGHVRQGIRALLLVAGKDYSNLCSQDLGFALGPRINAAGRLDDISQGIMLLTTESEGLAMELAKTLNDLNMQRRDLEQGMQEMAEHIVTSINASAEPRRGICLYHPDWHQGVVGLVASRMKEKYHVPVIVFAKEREEVDHTGKTVIYLKGSGRSIPGIHLRDLLDTLATKAPAILSKFGGHAMAAGLSLKLCDLEEFQRLFLKVLEGFDSHLFLPELLSDGEVKAEDLHLYNARSLRDILPWGQGLPSPAFDGEFILLEQKVVGEKHLKCRLQKVNETHFLPAIWFHCDVVTWLSVTRPKVHVVYTMDVNHFRGEASLQLTIRQMQMVPDASAR